MLNFELVPSKLKVQKFSERLQMQNTETYKAIFGKFPSGWMKVG